MTACSRIDSAHSTRPLSVRVEPNRKIARVLIDGELDIATGPALDAALRDLRAAGFDRLQVDLRGLTFLDGHGASQLRRWRELSQLEDFVLTFELPAGPARRVLDLTGLSAQL